MHDRYVPAKRIRGFTIMELVVVISCLGVLAAFAYPHFAMVEVEARKALVLSLGGSVNAAASQAHFLWLLQDRPATIDMEGQTITMVNGYPDEDDINNTLMDYSGFQFKINPAPVRFRRTDANQPNNCMVTYEDAVAGQRPAVVVFSSGC
jgi:MSHA pilin protein MshA